MVRGSGSSPSVRQRAKPAARQSARAAHTFHGNLQTTRHGWLRLTPAYSVRLVHALLDRTSTAGPVLDPFCGTATTLLACTERRVDCDTTDINPFLLWLARAKTARYPAASLDAARRALRRIVARAQSGDGAWLPPMHRIERWWDEATLHALGSAAAELELQRRALPPAAVNLLRLALCQAVIECSNASFGHQSMSLRASDGAGGGEQVAACLERGFERLASAASAGLPTTRRRIALADARHLHTVLPAEHYGVVITSPPYANRMSYVRELRPYMYWLRYLEDRKEAGALDWRAIGGTWGVATSNLARWQPSPELAIDHPGFEAQRAAIAERSPLLAAYVHKYCQDMLEHARSLARVVRRGGRVFVVVGNSKFYDVVLPVQSIVGSLLEQSGFRDVGIETLRKRSSKKELYEYLVSAERA